MNDNTVFKNRQATRFILVTPVRAAEALRDCFYPRQRPLRDAKVEELATAIRRGTFQPGEIKFAICAETGLMYLINGQHRLTAICRSDTPALLYPIFQTFQTMDEVDAAYAREDRGSPRTMGDVFKAFGVSDRYELPPTTLSRIGSAAPYILTGFRNRSGWESHSGDLRVNFLDDYANEIRAYVAALEGAEGRWSRTLLAAPVAAVALVTLRYQPSRAAAFWNTVAQNDGLRKSTPERALYDFLNAAPIQKIGRNRAVRGVAVCWNAAFQNRPLSLVKVWDERAPILIAGTPYKGRNGRAVNGSGKESAA